MDHNLYHAGLSLKAQENDRNTQGPESSAHETVRFIRPDVKELTTMRRLLIGISLFALLLMPLGAEATGTADADSLQQIAQVRQVLTKYHSVENALADGYIPVSGCEAIPGAGAMGVHYLNPSLASDLDIDPLAPEILLYVPSGNGLRLVGVEYWVASVGQPAPSVLGQTFDGPMAGHSPGMPDHYDLHAWIWQANPDGMFAAWNPSLSC